MTQFLASLVAWSGQIFVLVSVAAFAAVTIAHPKARLLFWQGILLLAVLIPVLEPWTPTPIDNGSISISAQPFPGITVQPGRAAARFQWEKRDWLLLLAAGAALRLIWIAGGFCRLRTYRKRARPLSTPPLPFVSGAASWYESDNVPGPVTYGWLRPAILLPTRVLALPAALREPIACHELVHVNRRDWLFVIVEEFLRSALWFHPAIWFVLSRIQLSREQVVDREVVRLTENREGYLDALVAVAEQSLLSDLAPAPLFLQKRQLAERVKEVLKEIPMSKSKIAAHLAGACSVTLVAALAAMWLFPFVSMAQTVNDGPGVSVNPGAPLIHRTRIGHPEGTTMSGAVVVEATINLKGEVTNARVLSGPEELRKTALSSVLQWHYLPGVSTAQAIINFEPVLATASVSAAAPEFGVQGGIGAGAGKSAGRAIAIPPPPPRPPPPPPVSNASAIPAFPATVKAIAFEGVGPEAAAQLMARFKFREGSTIGAGDLAGIAQTVQDYDSHLSAHYIFTATDANGRTMGLDVGASGGRVPLLPPIFATNGNPGVTIRVRAESAAGQFVTAVPTGQAPDQVDATTVEGLTPAKKVMPVYPTLAKSARIQGTVNFDAVINTDGTIAKLTLLNGHPLLVEAARAAVMQWVYTPSSSYVRTQISVNFTLQ
ncbi:MAG TPA: M56 family metallopeptidase [Bryobacteraceae bacterium]|jgi:hypothetical protein